MHEVWYAIPSANAENCRKNLPAWRALGYRVAVLQDGARVDVPADAIHVVPQYKGWASSVNELCRDVIPKSAAIVVSGGDDMLPDPRSTAQELARQFFETYPDGFGVMQPQGDAFEDTKHFCGSPWFGRAWIDRMHGGAGPMFPGYRHFCADDELYWVARGLDALWIRDDLTQYHDHFRRRGEDAPAYWSRSAHLHGSADMQLFIARASLEFPGHTPTGSARGYSHRHYEQEYGGRVQRVWESMYGLGARKSDDGARRFADALASCQRRGEHVVLIFGAGQHTKKLGEALREPCVRVAGIVDDDPSRQGGLLWNYPIMSVQQALTTQADAVLLSSDTVEEKLWLAAQPLARAGMRVVRLYGDATQSQRVA
jgi:hypothetical protein